MTLSRDGKHRFCKCGRAATLKVKITSNLVGQKAGLKTVHLCRADAQPVLELLTKADA